MSEKVDDAYLLGYAPEQDRFKEALKRLKDCRDIIDALVWQVERADARLDRMAALLRECEPVVKESAWHAELGKLRVAKERLEALAARIAAELEPT